MATMKIFVFMVSFLFVFSLGKIDRKIEGGFNLPAGRITTSQLITTIPKVGPFYRVSMKIRINKDVDNYAALFHFTTGANCCGHGSRIPGIFLWPRDKKLLQISSSVGYSGDYLYQMRYELHKWYEIIIEQGYRGSNGNYQYGDYKITINGQVVRHVWNYYPQTFTNVRLYKGSPTRYTDGIGNGATPDVTYEYLKFENQVSGSNDNTEEEDINSLNAV